MRSAPAVLLTMLVALAAPRAAAQGGSVLGTTRGGGEILTNEKVTAMVKAGYSEDIVIRVIQSASRTQFDLNVASGLLNLKKAGVSERVVNVMLDIWQKQRKRHDTNIRIFVQMMNTDRQSEYDRAMRELVAYGAYAVPLLIHNLRHESERVRAGCSEALGRIGDAASIDALFQAVVDRNPAVRAKAARALSAFDKDKVAPRIAEAIKQEGLPRDGYALALGYFRDRRYRKTLLDIADGLGSETDRAAAAFALALLNDPDPEILAVLKEAVLNDTFRNLREAASRALARLAPRMDGPTRADVARALVTAMRRMPVGRDILAMQLRHFPGSRSVEALIEQLDDRNRDVVLSSWEALKVITGEELPRDPDQWRSWWEIAQVQPRWREEPALLPAPGADGEFQPLPEIPELDPALRDEPAPDTEAPETPAPTEPQAD